MNRFFHSAWYKKPWVIVGISVGLFILGVALRLYRLEQLIWFDGDATISLLYAWNIVHYGNPVLTGVFSSGTTIPDPPIFLNVLAFFMWICGSNPATVIYLFAVITTAVVPLLFLWGVVEGSFLSGFIAAIVYAIYPGTFTYTNVWPPFLALVPCLAGVILFRWATKHHTVTYRLVGLYLLCLAGVIHYSCIGLLASVILCEFLRLRNIKQTLVDISVSAVVLVLLLFPMLVVLYETPPSRVAIMYLDGTCAFCLGKIPPLLQSSWSVLFWLNLQTPHAQQWLYTLAGCTLLVGVLVRRKLFAWGWYIALLFLLFAWVFTGQIAWWYLSPLVLVETYLFGNILAQGLRERHIYVRILSVVSLVLFIVILLCSYGVNRESYSPVSEIQTVIDRETRMRSALLSLGISGDWYIEYDSQSIKTELNSTNTAFWLIRQWKFHEVITYNDPQHSYNPALLTPRPLYRVYICRDCDQQKTVTLRKDIDGYEYECKVFLVDNDWMYLYKWKE